MRIIIHLTPKASHNKIERWAQNSQGQKILRVRVTAVPEDGRANEALIKLLSQSFQITKSQISIRRGATSRIKEVEIDGDVKFINNHQLES